MATSVSDSSSLRERLVLFKVISVTAITFLLTDTEQVADFSPALAVMVAVPSLTAVTLPLSTVATAESELLQVTVLSVASSGVTVATSVSESPSVKVKVVLLREIPVTATTFLLTATLQVADCSPALAVIEAEPSLTAVTLPLSSTVATFESDVDQVTVLSVASSGFTVAVRVSDPPSVSFSSVLFSVTEVTAMRLDCLTKIVCFKEPFC